MATDIDNLLALPRTERIDIMGRLWDSLCDEAEGPPIPDWHKEELDRRDREEPDDGPGRPWREVIDELRQEILADAND